MTRTVAFVFFVFVFVYFLCSVLYVFSLAIWGKFFFKKKKWDLPVVTPLKKIAILVPAYKEDNVILSTVANLLRLDYPRELFDVYIIADSFIAATLQDLRQLPVQVMEVSFENSTKIKSLNEAFKRIDKPYDIALICDGDNLLDKSFLKKINNAFLKGAKAVQGRRVAKNLDTSFAILDACSEAINHHIFRKGTNAIGLSSAICGSGMAFEFVTARDILSDIEAVGGFDKILQLKILQQNIFIHYLDNALVYDEKVDSAGVFAQQRKRWLASQLIYSKKFFFPAFRELFKGNVSYFNLAFANYCLLPRALYLVALPLLILASFYIGNDWGLSSIGLFLIYVLSLALALPAALVNRDLLRAVFTIPRAITLLVRVSFQLKRSDQRFIHTPHSKTGISHHSTAD
jgi:cellulose synthase/poly-beta-1,6-N-acetylglucosamine synthase-like glycosyltransferase